MNNKATIPADHMRNALGHLVPVELVREQDLLRDQVARSIGERARDLHERLQHFKAQALADIADLVKIAGARYEVQLGGKKGNVTITSYDGSIKVIRSVADNISFTEEIEAGKQLINQCIDRWSEGANANIRALVDRAFRTDSKGQMKTSAVLELLRLEIADEEWKRAMKAIADSIQTAGTSTYVRVYQRVGDSDSYVAIPLDLAAV